MTSTPSKPRPSRRRDILDLFARMVAKRGYDAVSIRDLAEHIDISKGTVIHHFGSKDRLLEEVHSEYMKRRLREIELILDRLDTPTEQLAGMMMQNLFAMQHDYDATVAFAREIVRFASEDIMANVREMRHQYSQIMRDILIKGMQEGAFRDEDPIMVSLQIFGMINWSWTWLRTEGSWKIEDLGAAFVRTMLSGINAESAVNEAFIPGVIDVVNQAMAEVASSEPAD
jgi:AcrR family transcriptional regulator